MKPIPATLLIIFVILKLCNLIHWDWIWILSPIWIPFILILNGEAYYKLQEERNKKEMENLKKIIKDYMEKA